MSSDKNFFKFRFFDELEIGDVFKFCPAIDSKINISTFFTVLNKTETTTTIQTTFGKVTARQINNNTITEIMVFPDRKRNIK
jgi:hypothetical protein